MRWAKHVAQRRRREWLQNFGHKSEGKGHLQDLGTGGRLILKGTEPVARSCLHDN